eukprot:5933777-Amphidinium_carterae.1
MGVIVVIAWLFELILWWDPVSTMLTLCMVGIVLFLLPLCLGCRLPCICCSTRRPRPEERCGHFSSSGHGIELHAVALQQTGIPFPESVAIKKTIGVEDFASIALAVT